MLAKLCVNKKRNLLKYNCAQKNLKNSFLHILMFQGFDLDFIQTLFSLEYDEQDRNVLPQEYLAQSVHIALELADNREDWVVFDYLMLKHEEVLKKHIEKCGEIFTWNFRNR